jgi:hypothetical protein
MVRGRPKAIDLDRVESAETRRSRRDALLLLMGRRGCPPDPKIFSIQWVYLLQPPF